MVPLDEPALAAVHGAGIDGPLVALAKANQPARPARPAAAHNERTLADAMNDALALHTRQAPQLATTAASLVASAALSTAPVLLSAPVGIVNLGLPLLGLAPHLPKQKDQ